MSQSDPIKGQENILEGGEEFPLKKYFNGLQKGADMVKNFNFKAFFEGLFTFISIIAAYLIVEFTFEHSKYLEKITNLKLKDPKTLPLLFLLLSLYLIFWNTIAHFLKKRALAPPSKVDQYQQIPENEEQTVPSLPPLPNGQLYTHEIIQDSLTKTIYIFLLLLSVCAYAYFNQTKRANIPRLVTIEKLSLCGIWFFMAVLLDLFGRLLQKLTKVSEFRVLGISIGFLVGALVLGLANDLNTFVFI